ncbi:cytochrome P450 [Streptomyces sp. NPDC058412]|uniref:cytochrome P450 n=1 Tax=Streptomyces TaxID=1883 RepID=UPI003663274C
MTTTETPGILARILDPSNRADPYPLYAELRKTPVAPQEDGSYVVSTYRAITELLHDPHVSSDLRNQTRPTPSAAYTEGTPEFINTDPPDHDRLRRMTMRHFGPPHSAGLVDGMRPALTATIGRLIDGFADKPQIDVVDEFAYPFPVGVICNLLGVPPEDEPRFSQWVIRISELVDYNPSLDPPEKLQNGTQALGDLHEYLAGLVQSHRSRPGEDLLSRLATDDGPDGRMTDEQIVTTATLILFAGHETTVNLISNGVLTLLRHPDMLQRLQSQPDLIIGVVEELLRYEPPVQIVPWRAAYSDVTIADTVIPKGAQIMLMLASGNRDPDRFHEPDRFDPSRQDNQHLGFGGGIHLCFGGPMARLEVQIALTEFFRRLDNPRLIADPPPYRRSPTLRGPLHLLVGQG